MDIKDLVRIARSRGWTVTQARRKRHWKFVSPDRTIPPVYTSSSPSDWRAARNARSVLRKYGLGV